MSRANASSAMDVQAEAGVQAVELGESPPLRIPLGLLRFLLKEKVGGTPPNTPVRGAAPSEPPPRGSLGPQRRFDLMLGVFAR